MMFKAIDWAKPIHARGMRPARVMGKLLGPVTHPWCIAVLLDPETGLEALVTSNERGVLFGSEQFGQFIENSVEYEQ